MSHLTGCEEELKTATVKQKTAERYSVLWNHHDTNKPTAEFHYDRVSRLLPAGHLTGRVLDAGCGQGIDSFRMAARSGAQVVSVDLSPGGVAATRRRTKALGTVHVVRGDLEQLPLAAERFDFVYSYGVLHHLPHPDRGLAELVRVLKPGGVLAVYLYEDFRCRSVVERALLWSVNRLRLLTVSLPPQWLYRLCQAGSPLVYLCLTIPAKIVHALGFPGLSRRIPYHHGAGPFDMAADLYDRFAAPIEKRYDGEEIGRWLRRYRLHDVTVLPLRGWVAYGRKPLPGAISAAQRTTA